MRIAVACRALLVAFLCLVPELVHAQGGVLGSIIGNVLDQTGQPLSGVKVVADRNVLSSTGYLIKTKDWTP